MTQIHSTLTVTQWLDFLCVNRSKLARKLGVSRQAVSYWERQNQIPYKYRAAFKETWKDKTTDQLFESVTE